MPARKRASVEQSDWLGGGCRPPFGNACRLTAAMIVSRLLSSTVRHCVVAAAAVPHFSRMTFAGSLTATCRNRGRGQRPAGLDRHRRSGRSDKGRRSSSRAVKGPATKGDRSIAVGCENSRKAQLPDPPESMHVTVDDGGQRPIAVALRGVFRGKDVGTEGDQLEAGSRGARNRDAPVPAAILLEHVERRRCLVQCW